MVSVCNPALGTVASPTAFSLRGPQRLAYMGGRPHTKTIVSPLGGRRARILASSTQPGMAVNVSVEPKPSGSGSSGAADHVDDLEAARRFDRVDLLAQKDVLRDLLP